MRIVSFFANEWMAAILDKIPNVFNTGKPRRLEGSDNEA